MGSGEREQPRDVTVRPATREDVALLGAFNRAMALETEGKELDPERLRAGIEAVFTDPARGRYLVAERDGAAVGSLLLTLEWSDWRNGEFWWIQSVYVAPEARRGGVFAALYHAVVEEARGTAGVAGIRLYVERENEGAQRVYEALGMQRSGYRFYEVDFVLGEK